MVSPGQLATRRTRGYPTATDDQRRRHKVAGKGQVKRPPVRGPQLVEAQSWAKRNHPSQTEVAFLRASQRRRLQFAISVLVIVLVLLATVGGAIWFRFQLPPDP